MCQMSACREEKGSETQVKEGRDKGKHRKGRQLLLEVWQIQTCGVQEVQNNSEKQIGISGTTEKERFKKGIVVKNISSVLGLEGSNGEPQPI